MQLVSISARSGLAASARQHFSSSDVTPLKDQPLADRLIGRPAKPVGVLKAVEDSVLTSWQAPPA
jgi:hypothetical protein